jgi:large-conductance mechanosensitive channel
MSVSEIDELTKSFGSVSTSMLTLGLATTGGRDWGDTLSVLKKTDSFLNQALFVIFIYFILIAVMIVIMGVFIDEAMKRLQPDTLERARHLAAQDEELESQLRDVCRMADKVGNKRLTESEWQDSMDRGSLKELLEMLDFRADHVHEFFMILSEESKAAGEPGVDIDRFVQGCLHLRGVATSFDMNTVLFKLGSMSQLMLQEISVLQEMQSAARAAARGQNSNQPL